MSGEKLMAGTSFPKLSWPTVNGGALNLTEIEGWRLLVVYRGQHCPICRRYLTTLNGLASDFGGAGIKVFAVSADTKAKAETEAQEEGWTFPVGFDLMPDQMNALGLYVSNPRSVEETDRPFSEPGLFVINPDGKVQVIDVSNAPFARPDLSQLLGGLKFVIGNDYPIRGMAG
ncbi:peroxiredoxin-like family protein [Rhizobium sp. PL01]|uniref:peroxiredoxin family protein n=1 Tax=Rhizobium sp. PL01 TaxID=3085631 RepID=UPI002980B4E6|nr:peroxiredoxin-like family protein [Rhizobium sp. PL01]MDW5318514.1 peroxiredoxin-like family protein [Rhizobium sp. PL01]